MRRYPFFGGARSLIFAIGVVLVIAACDAESPTATPLPTIAGAVAPTAVIDPVLPTAPGVTLESRLEFTPGASLTLPAVAISTEQALSIATGDVILAGSYLRADSNGSAVGMPTVVLLHGAGETRQSWGTLPGLIRAAGLNVIAFDWRGYGQSGGAVNWDLALQDLDSVVRTVSGYEGIDPTRVTFIGMGAGATLALAGCPVYAGCRGAVAISPTAVYGKLSAAGAMASFGTRSALFITSTEDDPSAIDVQALSDAVRGDKQILRIQGRAHSAVLLSAQPTLADQITAWIRAHSG